MHERVVLGVAVVQELGRKIADEAQISFFASPLRWEGIERTAKPRNPGVCCRRVMSAVEELGDSRSNGMPPMTVKHRADPASNRRHEITKRLEVAPIQASNSAIAQHHLKSVRLELQCGRKPFDAA
jgi:hypothetical protein